MWRKDQISYQRIDEAPQERRWWDLNPCTDKDPHFEPSLRWLNGPKATKHIWPPGVKSASKRASIFKQGSPQPFREGLNCTKLWNNLDMKGETSAVDLDPMGSL